MSRESPAAAADRLERACAAIGTPERAVQEKRYLKSDLDFLGATVWQIRAEVKAASAPSSAPGPRRADRTGRGAVGTADIRAADGGHRPARDAKRPAVRRRPGAARASAARVAHLGAGRRAGGRRGRRRPGGRSRMRTEPRAGPLGDRRRLLDPPLRAAGLAPAASRTARRSIGSWAMPTRCWTRRSSSSARRSAGCCARSASGVRVEVTDWLAPRTHRASGVTMREATKYLPPADARAADARVPGDDAPR